MRIAFLGTPDFALPCLQRLYDMGCDIAGVFSQPDRPKGRKMLLEPTPVKALAQSLGLPVYQFEKIRSEEGLSALSSLAPDLMVTAAFGQILSKENLAVPKYGCINVHASLLPKYRGAAPIQWAIIGGETSTGVTTMMTDEGLDTGDILLQRATDILPGETAGELFTRLSLLGADVLEDTIRALEGGTLTRTPQDGAQATHFPTLKKEDGLIDWKKDAQAIVNLVRGTNPWPVAHTMLSDQPLKIYAATARAQSAQPGHIFALSERGFLVGAGSGSVECIEVQAQGKKRMSAADFARGHSLVGETLA